MSAPDYGTPDAVDPFMVMLTAVMVLLLVALVTLPTWPYARRWSFYPSGTCGGIVLVIISLILLGRF